jgi:hypothetical protein
MILGGDGRPLALALDDGLPEPITDQLVSAAKKHQENPQAAKALAKELRQNVLLRFSPDLVANRLLETYEEELERKRKKG